MTKRLTVSFLMILIAGVAFAQVEGDAVNMTAINDGLSQNAAALRSARFQVDETKTLFKHLGNPSAKSRYDWAFNGDKVVKRTSSPGETVVVSFDGVKEEVRFYRGGDERTGKLMQSNVSTKGATLPNEPGPIAGPLQIKGRGISEIVSDGAFTATIGKKDPLFGATYIVSGKDSTGTSYNLTLAPERGYLCTSGSVQEQVGAVRTETKFCLNSAKYVEGAWVPESIDYHTRGNSQKNPKMIPFVDAIITAKVIGVNNLPDSYFTLPAIGNGTTVVDADSMTRYQQVQGQLVPKSGGLLSADNIWRWIFTVAAAAAVLSVVAYILQRFQRTA